MVTSIGFILSDGRLWVYSEFQQNKALIVLIDLKRHHIELYCVVCIFYNQSSLITFNCLFHFLFFSANQTV